MHHMQYSVRATFFFRCISYYSFYWYSKLQITAVGGNDSYVMTEQSCVQDKKMFEGV